MDVEVVDHQVDGLDVWVFRRQAEKSRSSTGMEAAVPG
jgi:hypothetical protein